MVSPIADTTTTTSLPCRLVSTMRSATRRIRSALATEDPPYFCTTSATVRPFQFRVAKKRWVAHKDKGSAEPIFPALTTGNLTSMAEQPTNRRAQTTVTVHLPIADRWSPRAFDPDAVLTGEQVIALLEAARWAATWGGRQPVRFVVGLRDDATFDTLAGLLRRGNAWAKSAAALILVCADEGEDENTSLYSGVDAGAAAANLSIEAVSRGLISHPMAGFDVDGSRAAFGIPPNVRPLMVIAVGSLGDYGQTSGDIADRDALPRRRLPLDEIAFSHTWGRPWQ